MLTTEYFTELSPTSFGKKKRVSEIIKQCIIYSLPENISFVTDIYEFRLKKHVYKVILK